jgi:hypothetical protein
MLHACNPMKIHITLPRILSKSHAAFPALLTERPHIQRDTTCTAQRTAVLTLEKIILCARLLEKATHSLHMVLGILARRENYSLALKLSWYLFDGAAHAYFWLGR